MDLLPGEQFTLEELTDAYNESREDYIVPMPMNMARLGEYIHLYDVDLSASWMAMDGRTKLGLGMLGVRHERAWITRLGVLPVGRRRGMGQALMDKLLESAAEREIGTIWLEVIKDNAPAYHLFLKNGFQETRELVVARRPPTGTVTAPELLKNSKINQVKTLHRAETLRRMARRTDRPNWLVETETMRNVPNLSALLVEMADGGRGWVSYNATMFQLTQIYVEVLEGDVPTVTAAALLTLHRYHTVQDAIMENLPAEDERWVGFEAMGYFEAFRRIEMCRTGIVSRSQS